jgi:hypothetical protein
MKINKNKNMQKNKTKDQQCKRNKVKKKDGNPLTIKEHIFYYITAPLILLKFIQNEKSKIILFLVVH